jgi:hypothetical protein
MMEVVVGVERLSDEKHKQVSSAGFLTDASASSGQAAKTTSAATLGSGVGKSASTNVDVEKAGSTTVANDANGGTSSTVTVAAGLSPAIARVLDEELPGLIGHLRVGGSAMVALIGGTGTGKTCKLKRLCVRISEAQHWQNVELPNHDEQGEADDDDDDDDDDDEGECDNVDNDDNDVEDDSSGNTIDSNGEGGEMGYKGEGGNEAMEVRQPKPERQHKQKRSQPSATPVALAVDSPSRFADQTKRLFLPVIIPMLEFAALVAERGLKGAKDDLVAEYFKCKYGKWSGVYQLFQLAKSSRRLLLFFDGYNELPSHQLDILHYVNLQLADQRQPLVIFSSTPATMPRDLLKHCLILQLVPLSRAQQLQLLDVAFRYHAAEEDEDEPSESAFNRYAIERKQNMKEARKMSSGDNDGPGGSGKLLVKSLTRNINTSFKEMQLEPNAPPARTSDKVKEREEKAQQPSSASGDGNVPRKPRRRGSLRDGLRTDTEKGAKEVDAQEVDTSEAKDAGERPAHAETKALAGVTETGMLGEEAQGAFSGSSPDLLAGAAKAEGKGTKLSHSRTAPVVGPSGSMAQESKKKQKTCKKRKKSAENYIIGDSAFKKKIAPTTLSDKARAAVVDRLDTSLAPYAQVPALLLGIMNTIYGKTSSKEHKRWAIVHRYRCMR